MKYLQNFTLPSDAVEGNWLYGNNPRTCYDSIYPFNFFSIENAFKYFTDSIQAGGLYILDEPENSLSVEMQMNLVKYIVGMTQFYECQFVISTHSPFILSIPNARKRRPSGERRYRVWFSTECPTNLLVGHISYCSADEA